MRPARRLPVYPSVAAPDAAPDARKSSGIRYRHRAGTHAVRIAVVDVRIPPHDPLPTLWGNDDDEDQDGHESPSAIDRMIVVTPLEVTSEYGLKIAIEPTEASIRLLSSRPPREEEDEPIRSSARRVAFDAAILALAFVVASAVTLAALRALSLY